MSSPNVKFLHDPTDVPTILGAIWLIVISGVFIIPSYGLVWYWPIPASFIGFGIYEWWTTHKWSRYESPILRAFVNSTAMTFLVVGCVLGGISATRLFRDLPAEEIGAVSIVGAVIGAVAVIAYLQNLLPESDSLSRKPLSKMSHESKMYIFSYFGFILALCIVSWLLATLRTY